MRKSAAREEMLIRRIQSLPPEKAAEVENFVDFLRHQADVPWTRAASKLSERVFNKVWDNPDDAVYDQL